MIKAYIDSIAPAVTVHRYALCEGAKVGPDEKIRHVLLDPGSISKEIDRFRGGKHRFSGEPYMNDMWLIFDFQDAEFEMALLKYLKKLIGLSTDVLKSCEIQTHC